MTPDAEQMVCALRVDPRTLTLNQIGMLLDSLRALVVVTPQGQPCFRSTNGIPMGMPTRTTRIVRATLRALLP